MDYGLSPHPALVLVLEGATEMTVIPRVMDMLNTPREAGFIELVNGGGVGRDFGFLAAYIAAPKLGESISDAIALTRPATRFLVVLDPEGPFATPEMREGKRQDWVEQINQTILATYGTPIARSELDQMVLVDTWGAAFEFAHFTDEEIAGAILATYRGATITAAEELTKRVGNIRRKGNLETLWREWAYPRPSKVAIINTLWPVLERKIRDAFAHENLEAIPVARIVLRVEALASEFVRHGLIIRRGE